MQAAVQARYGVHPWDEQIDLRLHLFRPNIREKTSAVRKLPCYGEA